MNEINVTVPGWMYDRFAAIAKLCGKTVEEVAVFYLATRWDTPDAKGASFCH